MYEQLLDGLKHSNTTYNWINRQNQEAAEAIESLQATNKTLLDALKDLFADYKALADSGDAVFWELEETEIGKRTLQAIAEAEGKEG